MARRRKTASAPDGARGWAEYVQSHLDALGWTNAVLAQKSEIDRSLIGRWLNEGTQPTIDSVRAVCNAFNVNFRQGLVEAGLATTAEMFPDRHEEVREPPDLRFVDDDTLLAEIERRLKRRNATAADRQEAASARWGGLMTEVSTQAGEDVGETQETSASRRVPASGSNGP